MTQRCSIDSKKQQQRRQQQQHREKETNGQHIVDGTGTVVPPQCRLTAMHSAREFGCDRCSCEIARRAYGRSPVRQRAEQRAGFRRYDVLPAFFWQAHTKRDRELGPSLL